MQYIDGLNPSGMSLKKEFNAIKKELFPFVYNVTKYAVQQPFLQLIDNFQENNIVEKKATQLEYKSKQKRNKLFINDRWFAFSYGTVLPLKRAYILLPSISYRPHQYPKSLTPFLSPWRLS